MKHYLIALAGLALSLVVAPLSAKADVVSQDELMRIANLDQDSCKLTQSIVAGQDAPFYGQSVAPAPVWKSVVSKSGVGLSFMWSPYWYIVGKQINWYDKSDDSNNFAVGRYEAGDACSFRRKYNINVLAGQTIARYFAPPTEGVANGTIVEQFTLNGRKAALLDVSGGLCYAEAIAVEVVKNKQTQTVVISRGCGTMDMEMVRMAVRVK
jgi:hypothetical protein